VRTLVEPAQLVRQGVEERALVMISDVGEEIVVNHDRGVVSVIGPFASRQGSFGNGRRGLAGASGRLSAILPTQQSDRHDEQSGHEQRQPGRHAVEHEVRQQPCGRDRDRADGGGSTVHDANVRPGSAPGACTR